MSKVVAFDLDDVLCYRSFEFENFGLLKYDYCKPNNNMIDVVNDLYKNGYIIKIYTARGMTQFSGDVNKIYSNLYEITLNQLKEWKINFHELIMGKIHYDILIDDKALNSLQINYKDDIINFLNKNDKNKK
jgi:hypothetical protein